MAELATQTDVLVADRVSRKFRFDEAQGAIRISTLRTQPSLEINEWERREEKIPQADQAHIPNYSAP
jgi:hypothetical protein